MKRWLCLWAVALLCACNGPPTLNAIEPATGYPRQLLAVDGTTFFVSVVWDVGLPTEEVITVGFLGTRYFQIPENAAPGVHPVATRWGSSNTSVDTVNVTVLPSSGTFPAPRIETIDVYSTAPKPGDKIDVLLMISAANLDTFGTVEVNGASVVSVFFGGLPVDYLQSHKPATYGYPIYHYGQLAAVVEDTSWGTTLSVKVTNTDGLSATEDYTLPASAAELDRDGDGLLDSWEESGTYTAPSSNTIDVGAMGVELRRKDILVEADWVAAATPNGTIWTAIEDVFAAAPVLNPDGSVGINIHIDRGQGAPFDDGGEILADHTKMDFDPVTAASPPGYESFFTYKTSNFDADRLLLFHYCVFGRDRPDGLSGTGEIWGNDFMVTFTSNVNWGVDIAEVGTFVHELGHNLGLRHGGVDNAAQDENERHKPNMASSLNYRWQFSGVSNDCDWTSDNIHTYSAGMYATVNEITGVNENDGICDNAALDMNEDGSITSGPMDTNKDGSPDVHLDYDQWGFLKFDFDLPGSRWNGN